MTGPYTDRMAFHMARKAAGKLGKSQNEKVQLSLPPATLKRLRIAAAELGLDMSEVVTGLIDARFSGVHVRGMNPGTPPSAGAGQGSGTEEFEPNSTVVKISGVTNRIGDIARRSTAPIDSAIEGLDSE